jgi:hypothetical protein
MYIYQNNLDYSNNGMGYGYNGFNNYGLKNNCNNGFMNQRRY